MKKINFIFIFAFSLTIALSACNNKDSNTTTLEENNIPKETTTLEGSNISEKTTTSEENTLLENNTILEETTSIEDNMLSEETALIEDNIETTSTEKEISYDALEQLYLNINDSMDYDTVLNTVIESQLPYTTADYYRSKSIKVAFTEGSAAQRYADSGDYIDISFKMDGDYSKNYVFGAIKYVNDKKAISAFQYVFGDYNEFRDGEYQGYYINDYQFKDRFEIVYSNGHKTMTNYIPLENKEAQLAYIHDYVKPD